MKKITNKELQKYYNFLINIKGFSYRTASVYIFYINKLNNLNNDYIALMNNYNGLKNNTKRVILSAIKNYYKYINDINMNEIILPKKDIVIKDYITFDEYKKLLDIYQNKFSKILIIKLLFETGIRSSELIAIKVKDINNQKVVINGKGNKQRIIWISTKLAYFIEQYIEEKKLDENVSLFNFEYRNLYKHVKKFGNKINKDLTPHMFRRGFATYCIDANVGIYEISLMMGHEDINTTKTYLRNERKIEIMKFLFE